MRVPHVRFTVRRMMGATAGLALLIGGARWFQQRAYCRTQIVQHAMGEQQALRLVARLERDATGWGRAGERATPDAIRQDPRLAEAEERGGELRSAVAYLRRQAAYHARMRRIYERAAANPWAPVPEEPPPNR
jgi:hypothetical protein